DAHFNGPTDWSLARFLAQSIALRSPASQQKMRSESRWPVRPRILDVRLVSAYWSRSRSLSFWWVAVAPERAGTDLERWPIRSLEVSARSRRADEATSLPVRWPPVPR